MSRRTARSRAWPAIRGATPYTSSICPRVPSRPPSIALLTLYCDISFTLPVSLVRPLPLCLPRRLLQLPCQPRAPYVRGDSERLQMVSYGRAHPPPCRHLGTCRHLSPPVGTLGRWRPGGASSHSALPAAPAVLPRTVAGGHQAGWSIGTEPALCQTSIRALQQVAFRLCRRRWSN